MATYDDGVTCTSCWGIVAPEGVTMVPDDGELCNCGENRPYVRRIRANFAPIILTSRRSSTNVILDVTRDLYSGDMSEWATDVLWATQILRMAYDSPRIGGGIDPAIATNVPGLEWGRLDSYALAYVIGSPDQPYGDEYDSESMGALDGYSADAIQGMIVHAEAVALLTLGVYGRIE